MIGVGIELDVQALFDGLVNPFECLVAGFEGPGPHKYQMGNLKTHPRFPGDIQHLVHGQQVTGLIPVERQNIIQQDLRGAHRVSRRERGISPEMHRQDFVFPFNEFCDLSEFIAGGEYPRFILQAQRHAGRAFIHGLFQKQEHLFHLFPLYWSGIESADGGSGGAVSRQDHHIVGHFVFLQVSEVLRHGIPLDLEKTLCPGGDLTHKGAILAKPRHTVAALTGHKGGYALGGEGKLQFIMSFDGQVPVHMGMGVDDPRHDDQSAAVDNLTGHVDLVGGDFLDLPVVDKQTAVKTLFPGAVYDQAVLQQGIFPPFKGNGRLRRLRRCRCGVCFVST